MSTQDKNTAIGAGTGAVAGAGSLRVAARSAPIGGAAVGGIIGHEVSEPKK